MSDLTIKNLEEEKRIVGEPVNKNDWISILFNIFFSTGVEINKQKET